jgi:hypothetical protein
MERTREELENEDLQALYLEYVENADAAPTQAARAF